MAARRVTDLAYTRLLSLVSPSCTARVAARTMAERNIGAVMVAELGLLRGIFTERDVAYRVVAEGRDPDIVTVAECMTRDPVTITPRTGPSEALDLMRRHGCRHLPVLDEGRIVGMLSIRDLYAAMHDEMQEDLRLRDEMIMGSGYSVTH